MPENPNRNTNIIFVLMRNTLLLILILTYSAFYAQTAKQEIAFSAGSNLNWIDSTLKKNCYNYFLPNRIENFHLAGEQLIVQFREQKKATLKSKGEYISLNRDSKLINWSTEFSYVSEHLTTVNGHLIRYKENNNRCINPITGERLWWAKNHYLLVDTKRNIGIGYRNTTYASTYNTLDGIDLSNGEILWSREVNRNGAWNMALKTDDSTYLISTLGLYELNTKTGEGWEVAVKKGRNPEKSGIAAAALLGGLTGVLIYNLAVPRGNNQKFNVLQKSNVLAVENKIYYTDDKSLYHLDILGTKIWEKEINTNNFKNSNLFVHESYFVLIDGGYKYFKGKKVSDGKAQIIIFDKETGEQVHNADISNDPLELVADYNIDGNFLNLVLKRSIIKFDLNRLSIKKSLIPSQTIEPRFEVIANETRLVKKGDLFVSINEMYPNSLNVIDLSSNLYRFDENLELIESIPLDIYRIKESIGQFSIISNKTKRLLLNKNFEPIVRLHIDTKVKLFEGDLYINRGNMLNVIKRD